MPQEDLIKTLYSLSNLIHQIQKERGFSSFYLRNISNFKEELQKQTKISDTILKEVYDLFADEKENSKILYFLSSLEKINQHRSQIINRQIDVNRAILFYNREIVAPIIDIISELTVFNANCDANKISIYINFLQFKERTGLQRAAGASLVTNNNSQDDKISLPQIRHLILEQNAYQRVLFSLTDEEQKAYLENKINQNHFVKEVKKINDIILNKENPRKELLSVSLDKWLELFNGKIDFFHEIEKELIVNVSSANKNNKNQSLAVKEAVKSCNTIDINVIRHIELIKNLPFFIGLEESQINEILQNSHINNYKKGALLFLEGERAIRFYIILEGWVKLFNGNDEGEESVMQMLSPGRAIVETSVLLNTAFPVSAKIIENAKILSVPAGIIRSYIKKNSCLASNLLAGLANQSKELIHQLGQLTLKTAGQRVGWFLLNLFLENGQEKESINLPYDKSLIASSLGMKPETLSRALQSLKEEGNIMIERNTITLSDSFALCDYCDIETASKCKRHDDKECPNPDIIK